MPPIIVLPNTNNLKQANCGGTLFFFFIGLTDKFSWLIEFVLFLCAASNALWWYMFNELHRSWNTQMIFAAGMCLSFLGAALHCRRPPQDPESDSDEDSDDDEELTEEEFIEKIQQEERELAALKELQKQRLDGVKNGTPAPATEGLVQRKTATKILKDEANEVSNF